MNKGEQDTEGDSGKSLYGEGRAGAETGQRTTLTEIAAALQADREELVLAMESGAEGGVPAADDLSGGWQQYLPGG